MRTTPMITNIENKISGEDPQCEEILSFIATKGLVRWTDLTVKFEQERKWHHSKFVKHWKHIKEKYLAKVPNEKTGRSWYKIRDQSQSIGEKALLRTQINNGNLSSVEISPERFGKVAEQLKQTFADLTLETIEHDFSKIKNQFDAEIATKMHSQSDINKSQKKGIIEKIKRSPNKEISKQTQASVDFLAYCEAFRQHDELAENLKKQLTEVFEGVKIQIVTSPGETAPILTNDDIIKILTIVFPKIMDENKGRPREKPFQLIISFPAFYPTSLNFRLFKIT